MKVLNSFVMIIMNFNLCLVLLSFFSSCNFNSVTKISSDKNKQQDCFKKNELYLGDSTHVKNILKQISKVKEVDEFSKLNEDTISYCIVDYNYKNEGIYKIDVGLDFDTHFSTRFVFYANKKNNDIKILEVVRDTIMTIDDWRNASWLK